MHDQDEALDFYTRTLGWEVRADVTMEEWHFRWLVVGPAAVVATTEWGGGLRLRPRTAAGTPPSPRR